MDRDDETPADERLARLEERVARLERAVSELHDTVTTLPDDAEAAEGASSETPAEAEAGLTRRSGGPSVPERIREADWLSYAGIGLLLFGVAFLFRYSVEQGWLGPAVRVGIGAVTGVVLLGAGLRVYTERRRLRQILLGGSSAVFYGTVFAAHQLYGLLAYPTAFGGMVVITVLSIAGALRQDEAVLAVVGTAGGLGTPFLLYSAAEGVAGLAGYTCLVLGGACAVYLSRGWRSLLGVAAVGGWIVLLVPCAEAAFAGRPPPGAWGLQAGLVTAWALLGGTPTLRAGLRARAPDRWPRPSLPGWMQGLEGPDVAAGAATTAPFLALGGSRVLWGGAGGVWAAVALLGTLAYAAAFVLLRRKSLPTQALAHGLVAAGLAAYGVGEALGGAPLLLAWAAEAALLVRLGPPLGEKGLERAGHALWGLVAAVLALRLSSARTGGHPLLTGAALCELGVVALAAATARRYRGRWLRRLYGGGALAAWLAWWVHELAALPQGQVYVSAAWGSTAAALLVYGTWQGRAAGQWAGLATLALFVGKLFLVDLATVPALWRISLFLGAGSGFLLISYALPLVGLRSAKE